MNTFEQHFEMGFYCSANLVSCRQIGVKVMLPVERGNAVDPAAEGQGGLDPCLDAASIQNRKCAWRRRVKQCNLSAVQVSSLQSSPLKLFIIVGKISFSRFFRKKINLAILMTMKLFRFLGCCKVSIVFVPEC